MYKQKATDGPAAENAQTQPKESFLVKAKHYTLCFFSIMWLPFAGASCRQDDSANSSGYITFANPDPTMTSKSDSNNNNANSANRDSDKLLEALLKKEKEERKQGDADLEVSIAAVTRRIDKLEVDLRSEIKRLDAKDAELEKKIVDESEERNAEISALRADLNRVATDTKAEVDRYRAAMNQQLEDLKTSQADLQAQVTADKMRHDQKKLELNSKIEDLKKTTTDQAALFKTRLEQERDSLRADLTKTNEMLADEGKRRADLEEKLKASETNLKMSQEQMAAALKIQLGDDVKQLNTSLADIQKKINSNSEQLTALTAMVGDAVSELKSSDRDIENRIVAKINKKIYDINKDFQKFKEYAAKTYATKQEVKALSLAVEALNQVNSLLNKKIDDRMTILSNKIDIKIAQTTADLENKIRAVGADVESLRDEFAEHVKKYESDSVAMYDELGKEINSLRSQAMDMNRTQTQENERLKAGIAALTVKTANVEYFAIKTKNTLTKKIQALEAADASLADDVREARQEAAEQLTISIHKQEEMRDNIQKKINELTKDLDGASSKAQAALDLSLANQQAAVGLSSELAKTRDDFKSELASLESRMQNRLSEVKDYATSITKDLSAEVQQKFTEMNGRIGEVEQQLAAGQDSLGRILHNELEGITPTTVKPQFDLVLALLNEYNAARMSAETEFVDAIDPVLKGKDVDIDALEADFLRKIATNQSCEGIQSPDDKGFSTVQGREFFFHLSRAYVQSLVMGIRTEDKAIDAIFRNLSGLSGETGLGNMVVFGASASYAQAATGKCQSLVVSWTRDRLFEKNSDGDKLRTALSKSPKFLNAVVIMYDKALKTRDAANNLQAILIDLLKDNKGSKELANAFLRESSNDSASPLAQIAQLLLESAEKQLYLVESKADRDNYIELARDVAKIKSQAQENPAILTKFDQDIKGLQNAVSQLSQTVKSVQADVKTLRSAQSDTFNIVSAIAARLGYADLVNATAQAAAKTGGTVDPSLAAMPAQCIAAQHFYNHATIKTAPVSRCESNITYGNSILDYYALTRCAIHSNGSGANWRTWGNQTAVSNGWDSRNQISGGQIVGDGLTIPSRDPSDLQTRALAVRTGGSVYPTDGLSTFVLRVFGRAAKFKIDVSSVSNTKFDPYSVTVDAADYLVQGSGSNLVYEIPLPKAIGKLGACRWDRDIKIVALDENSNAGNRSCVHRFHTFSPVVLNFNGADMVKTTSPYQSPVRFDLDANGIPESTGWVQQGAGLLAIDLSGNGKIDSGRELFGEATTLLRKPAEKAVNGYEAMAQYDSNHDGVLDARDPVFERLLVWFDINHDGKSSAHELKHVKDLGITRIAVTYSDVKAEQQIQTFEHPESNIVKYESRFWGPADCGQQGCKSFDVYFGSTESTFALN